MFHIVNTYNIHLYTLKTNIIGIDNIKYIVQHSTEQVKFLKLLPTFLKVVKNTIDYFCCGGFKFKDTL